MRSVAGAVLLLSSMALAEEPTFEALGQAPIVANDRARARDRAFEEALRQAVEQATATVLEPTELVSRASELKLRIYPKARGYVTTYRVLDEGEPTPGTFQVHLSAAVATAKLARDLSTASVPLPPGRRARLVVCADAKGDNADEAAAASDKALRELIAARNFDPLPGGRPCDPASAAQVVKSGGAQAALTAEVQLDGAGPIRGTDLVGVGARATVRVVGASGDAGASAEASEGGYASSAAEAATEAARASVLTAAHGVDHALSPRAADSGRGVLVRIMGLSRWSEYVALKSALSAVPGVATVEPRRFVRGEVDLYVHTAAAATQLAAHLNRVPPAGMRVGVKSAGDIVDITISGEAEERG